MKACEGPFGDAVGGVDGGGVGGFDVVLGDYVDGAFFRGGEIGESVFCVGEAAGEADYEEGRVVVYYLGVGERGEVCRFAWVEGVSN